MRRSLPPKLNGRRYPALRMAEIRPFRGTRYSPAAGPLGTLVAPPYDVLSDRQRQAFANESEHNIVHLTLPEGKPDDRSKHVKYMRSAAALAQWRKEGAFVPDPEPRFYRYVQTFSAEEYGEPVTRTSLIVVIKVEPFENGTVLPHEQTFPKHKEDRLRLLEATRTHLESIFGLYDDPDGSVHHLVSSAPITESLECDVDDVLHRLEPIAEPGSLGALVEAMADKRIWIADGHHRYETALNFRSAAGARDHPIAEDYIEIALCSMSDPGLILLPTHRIVPKLLSMSGTELKEAVGNYFSIQPHPAEGLWAELNRPGPEHRFGVVLGDGIGLLLTPTTDLNSGGPGSDRLRQLDASILHSVLLPALGVTNPEQIEYTRSVSDAVAAGREGKGASFLMLPPSVQDMKDVALNGERMPQKSTYYYPKIFSGFVAWSLSDFEP